MLETARLNLQNRNPDVLTCIANLSNDEVFTPPEFANRMLDTVAEAWAGANDGAEIWADRTVRFLDPFTKSGVFLREIVSRLSRGLEDEIPNLQERVDHILKNQVFGIGITHLTSLMARRSVYCSKWANGKHSIATVFDGEQGNIWFEPQDHTWVGGSERILTADKAGAPIEITLDGKCKYCGANQKNYDRAGGLETHAYAFIHTDRISEMLTELFGDEMQFDVIIGNPPYQLNDGGGGGSSASPIYQKFVDQAQKLEPRLLSMVIPARWYSGGKGLDGFRASMLQDRRVRYLADFPDSREAFSGVDVAGGVCYFLWDRDSKGPCVVDTFVGGQQFRATRRLDEFDSFVRDNRTLAVIKKVLKTQDDSFASLVSSRKPFGLESAEAGEPAGDLYLYASGTDTRIWRKDVPKGHELIDSWKVLLSKTSSEHAGQTDRAGMKRVLSRIEVMAPGSVATESYLVVGPFSSRQQAENAALYLKTRFVRFLLAAILLTQNISKGMFKFVPSQGFHERWTDEMLYEKYGLNDLEIALIESTIRPMESADGSSAAKA